jgi:hypothetical protein
MFAFFPLRSLLNPELPLERRSSFRIPQATALLSDIPIENRALVSHSLQDDLS